MSDTPHTREHDRPAHELEPVRFWYPRFQEWLTVEEYFYRKGADHWQLTSKPTAA